MQNITIQQYVDEISAQLKHDVNLQKLFQNCFLSTLNTTVQHDENGVFIVTGDISAMWLRDSSAQVHHYLPLAARNHKIAALISGLIYRQILYINIDAYANAFNASPNCQGHVTDHTLQSPWVFERKYELDSLCYPLQLAYLYWKETNDANIFDKNFLSAVSTILYLWEVEQNHASSPYYFTRTNCPQSDTLSNGGRGDNVAYTGMTWSGFRPSDDACKYGYLIPSNMFAVVALKGLCEILQNAYQGETALLEKAKQLLNDISIGIEKYGTVIHPEFGQIYVYETDGNGNYSLMDDANMPSLISIPYLGYCSTSSQIYQNTRRFVLSKANPYFYSGKYASGVGSPHTPNQYIWHIALALQALTSESRIEQQGIINTLLATHADTFQMHESFNPDNPKEYTRSWFAWANSICAEAIIKYAFYN